MSAWALPQLSTDELQAIRRLLDARDASRHLTAEKCNGFYTVGMQLYRQGNYERASHFFKFLRHHRPMEYRYLLAHALSLKMQHQYDAALKALSAASLLERDNPEPLLHAAECLFACSRTEPAIALMKEVEKLAKGQEKYRGLIDRAEGWLALAAQA